MKHIQRELTSENVCVVRFDQAGSRANVFNLETIRELDEHLLAIAGDSAIRGIVIISAKERIFCAGADLILLSGLTDDKLREFLELGQSVLDRLSRMPVPKVAAIHGACVGGGFELALACDYRIASDDRATKIGLPETNLGILPAWGGATRLPRLVGVPRALDVILAGKTLAAKHALKAGMIDEIAPREYLLCAALRAIQRGLPARRKPLSRFAGMFIGPVVWRKTQQKTRGHYPAVPMVAEIVMKSPVSSVEVSLKRERDGIMVLARTEACRNLIRLFFQQEHAKKPVEGESKPVKSVAVIGAGVMGAGIAQWLAARGLRVLLRDIEPKYVAAGMARIEKLFGNKRAFSRHEAREALDRITPVATEVSLANVDLVIEAAVEKMDAKKKIFARLDELAGDRDVVLATNTSALSLAEVAGATKRPERVVGLHFFNPVHRMQLVEVVRGTQTSDAVLQRAVRFAQQIGKLPVVVKDSPGFLVNRILLPYLSEAGRLFEAGAKVDDIDEAMLEFGMPMGPLRLIDEVGVDIAADVAATLAAKFPDRMQVPGVLAGLMGEKWLGMKTGRGFYVNGVKPNEAAGKFRRGNTAAGLSRVELQRQMVLLMVNEAARCVDEKIATGPADVDFAMVMGTGFAPFRGGPLRYADAAGLVEGRKFYED